MKTINFKQFNHFNDISKKSVTVIDVSEQLANLLYTRINGIAAHSLAMKIYEGTDAIEITERDEQDLMSVIEEYCTPIFIDSFKHNLKEVNVIETE